MSQPRSEDDSLRRILSLFRRAWKPGTNPTRQGAYDEQRYGPPAYPSYRPAPNGYYPRSGYRPYGYADPSDDQDRGAAIE
jgi:hypothetical protein